MLNNKRKCVIHEIIAIRGFRGKRFKENTIPISSLSYNLIDFDKVELQCLKVRVVFFHLIFIQYKN